MVFRVHLDFKCFNLSAKLSLSFGRLCICIMAPRLRLLSRRGSQRARPGDDPANAARRFDWGDFHYAEIPAQIEAEIVSQEEALLKENEFREGLS